MASRSPLLNFSRGTTLFFWLYIALLVVVYGTAINKADTDLWHRFLVADYLFHTGHFAPGNTFAYLGTPSIKPDIEWGSAIVLYGTFLLSGGTGIVILKLVALGATVALTIRAGLGRQAPTMLHAFFYNLIILGLISSFLSTVRAEAATHVLFALWILWFQQERRGCRISIWTYVLTMAIWVNLHGGFILGFIWLGALALLEFATGGDWKRRVKIFALCLVATLLNPFGYQMWIAVFEALFIPRIGFEEWAPVPWLHDIGHFAGYKLLVLWVAATVAVHVYRSGWRKSDVTSIALLGLFLIPSLLHARQTSIFAIVAGGLLPPLFLPEKHLSEIHEWKPWLTRVIVRSILVILPLIYALKLMPANQGLHLTYPPETAPVGAIQYLKASGTTGNLLVDYNAGSYASWELRDKMRVSLSSRYEAVFTYATFEKVQRFYAREEHWQDALTDPKPDAILVSRTDPIYGTLLTERDWTQVYQDTTNAVFKPASP